METRVQDKWWKALCGVGLLTFFALSFFCDPHSEPDDDWTYSYLIAGRMGPLGTNHYMNPALVGVLKAISRVLPWLSTGFKIADAPIRRKKVFASSTLPA